MITSYSLGVLVLKYFPQEQPDEGGSPFSAPDGAAQPARAWAGCPDGADG
jgi:hypothetical protein